MKRSPLMAVLRLGAFVVISGLCMGSSCLNPCQQLSDKICSCLPTDAERQACKRQTQLQQNQRTITNEDRLYCQRTLGNCECRALTEGRIEACGLSRE